MPVAYRARLPPLTARVTAAQLAAGLPLLETLVAAGLARSKGAARTLVGQGLYVRDRR